MAEMRAAVLQKDRLLVVQSITRPHIIPGSSIDTGKVQHHPEDLHATLLGMLNSLLSFDWAYACMQNNNLKLCALQNNATHES